MVALTPRKHVRLKTRHEARIRFPSETAIPCEIRDFCETGLFLHLLGKHATRFLGMSVFQSHVTVEFLGEADSKRQEFKITGKVVHFSEAGFGIYAKSIAPEAFQALKNARDKLYRAANEAKPSHLEFIDVQTIRTQCLSLYRPFLARVIEAFFTLAKERGDEELDASHGLANANPYASGLAELRLNQERISQRFIDSALGRVERQEDQESTPMPDVGGQESSITEEKEFEDWLNLAAVINKLEAQLQEPLGQFDWLYGLLQTRIRGSAPEGAAGAGNPFGPAAHCGAFQASLRGLKLETTQRAQFYRLYGQAAGMHGEEFYHGLARVASLAERRQNRPGTNRRSSDRKPPQEASDYSLDNTLSALNTAPAANADAAGTGAESDSTQQSGQYHSLRQTTEKLLQALSLTVQQAPVSDSSQDLKHPQPTDTGLRSANTEELLHAIDSVFKSRQGTQQSDWQPLTAEQLQDRLQQSLGPSSQIAPEQQQTLELLASLFSKVIQELAEASDLAGLIQRFEHLFFRLGFEDSEFLQSDSHPARQVLNLLDRFAVACNDEGTFYDPKLHRMLTFLVDNITEKVAHEQDILPKAAQTLSKMLQSLEQVRLRRTYRLQETCEGWDRVQRARQQALIKLKEQLAGRDIPSAFVRLLDAGWRRHLSLLALREGVLGNEWRTAIDMMEQLLSWLSPAFTPPDDFSSQSRSLLLDFRSRIVTVCVEPSRMSSALAELERLLAMRVQKPDAAIETQRLDPGTLSREIEDTDADLTENGRFTNQLALGGWWNIVGAKGKAVPMQLIWLSQPPGSCGFASRSATTKLDFTIAEFARRHEAGEVEPTTDKDVPLMARAQGALADDVYRQLMYQRTHDPVTNLLNRNGMLQHLTAMITKPDPDGKRHSFCLIELPQLGGLPPQYAPERRGAILRQIAGELKTRLQSRDWLSMLRDDSFAAVLANSDLSQSQRRLSAFIEWLKPLRFEGEDGGFSIGANAGLAEFMTGSLQAEEILRRANAACTYAKSLGLNQIRVYAAEDTVAQERESLMDVARHIDQVMEDDRLYLRCQRISPAGSNPDLQPYYEILLGVCSPDSGAELPTLPFLLAVASRNRAHDVDRWVISHALQWMREHADAFATIGGFSINLSPQSLNNEELLAFLHRELSTPGIPLDKITFEIAETGANASHAATLEFIQQIRFYGCKFAVDDFGSGQTSLAYLKNLQTDTLKIDGMFIRDMLTSPADYAMVKSMSEIGHSLGMQVVAKFVPTHEILEALRELGVDYVQGYAIHKPMPLDQLLSDAESTDTSGDPGPHPDQPSYQ